MAETNAKRQYAACELNRFTRDIETLLIPIVRQPTATLEPPSHCETQGVSSTRCLEQANLFSAVPERSRNVATNQHHAVARDRPASTD